MQTFDEILDMKFGKNAPISSTSITTTLLKTLKSTTTSNPTNSQFNNAILVTTSETIENNSMNRQELLNIIAKNGVIAICVIPGCLLIVTTIFLILILRKCNEYLMVILFIFINLKIKF